MGKHTLPNGIVLDTDWGQAPTLTKYARRKGFADVFVCHAVHPDGAESYVLVQGQEALFESQSAEAVAVRLDMMAADRDLPK